MKRLLEGSNRLVSVPTKRGCYISILNIIQVFGGGKRGKREKGEEREGGRERRGSFVDVFFC